MSRSVCSHGLLAAIVFLVSSEAGGACSVASLFGTRTFATDCGDGSCAVYQVGDSATDLGFGSSLPDLIYFEFYSAATGTFDLGSGANANYLSCAQCIHVLQDLDPQTSDPQKQLFQSGGSLTIDMNTVPGAADIGLTWSNLQLVEVTIDPNTFESTPVPGGVCLSILPDPVFVDGFEVPVG